MEFSFFYFFTLLPVFNNFYLQHDQRSNRFSSWAHKTNMHIIFLEQRLKPSSSSLRSLDSFTPFLNLQWFTSISSSTQKFQKKLYLDCKQPKNSKKHELCSLKSYLSSLSFSLKFSHAFALNFFEKMGASFILFLSLVLRQRGIGKSGGGNKCFLGEMGEWSVALVFVVWAVFAMWNPLIYSLLSSCQVTHFGFD